MHITNCQKDRQTSTYKDSKGTCIHLAQLVLRTLSLLKCWITPLEVEQTKLGVCMSSVTSRPSTEECRTKVALPTLGANLEDGVESKRNEKVGTGLNVLGEDMGGFDL